MVKLLVVDDEAVTRKGIIKHIHWNLLGIDSISEAADGQEALNFAQESTPDIVISDVRMPRLNGLEFAKKLRATQPNVKFIFLSGFSDKEYLKDAIKVNAIRYVEKPIDLEELTEAIQEAVSLHRQEQAALAENENMNTLLHNSLPFIKQTIITELVSSGEITSDLLHNLQLSKLPLDSYCSFAALLIKTTAIPIVGTLIPAVESILRDTCLVGTAEGGCIVLLYGHSPHSFPEIIQSFYHQLVKSCTPPGFPSPRIFCTVGCFVDKINRIFESYSTALSLQKRLFFYGSHQLAFYQQETTPAYFPPHQLKSDMNALLTKQSYDDIEKEVEALFRSFFLYKNTPPSEIKHLLFDIMELLFQEAEARGIEELSGRNNLWESISAAQTLEKLQVDCLSTLREVFEKLREIDSNNKSITNLISYMQENCGNPQMGVKFLSEHVYLTPTYLSSLFRKKTGTTISDYLLDIRITQAKKLLLDPQLKLTEVAQKTGYLDANYFSKVFKKSTGISPSAYRERYLKYED